MKRMKSWREAVLPLAILALPALALAACESTAVEEEEEHAEPEGVELVMNGSVVAAYDGDDQSWTADIEVDAGEETAQISVRFVDHDGDQVPLEDEEFGLGMVIDDESVATWEQDASNEYAGRLHGGAEGSTGMTVQLLHGGHPDFVTTPVTVRVEASSS